jgi:hypothetical protein
MMRPYTESEVREILEIQRGIQNFGSGDLGHALNQLERMKRYPQFFSDAIDEYERRLREITENIGHRSLKKRLVPYAVDRCFLSVSSEVIVNPLNNLDIL